MGNNLNNAHKKWALRAGMIAGSTGAIFSFLLGTIVLGIDSLVFMYTPIAFFATGGIGYILWKLLNKDTYLISKGVGAIAGALIGLLPNPIVWTILFLAEYIINEEFFSLITLLDSILWALGASVVSFTYFGWLSVPIGFFGGAIISHYQANDPAFQTINPEKLIGQRITPAARARF